MDDDKREAAKNFDDYMDELTDEERGRIRERAMELMAIDEAYREYCREVACRWGGFGFSMGVIVATLIEWWAR